MAVILAKVCSWDWTKKEQELDPEQQVKRLRGMLTRACNAAMPRVKSCSGRRAAYWWMEITHLRRTSVHANSWNAPGGGVEISRGLRRLCDEYQAAKMDFSAAIRAVKAKAWDELIQYLARDPWGHPSRKLDLRRNSWYVEDLPWERYSRCCHLHRTREKEDRDCHGRHIRSEASRKNSVRLLWLSEERWTFSY